MLRKIKKLGAILKYYFTDEDNLLLHLIEMKAYETLDDCFELDVGMTEEVEDLIFHIRTYYEIPESLAQTKYTWYKGEDIPEMIKKYKKGILNMADIEAFTDYLTEVEELRAVERDLIFEHVKALAFGFKL